MRPSARRRQRLPRRRRLHLPGMDGNSLHAPNKRAFTRTGRRDRRRSPERVCLHDRRQHRRRRRCARRQLSPDSRRRTVHGRHRPDGAARHEADLVTRPTSPCTATRRMFRSTSAWACRWRGTDWVQSGSMNMLRELHCAAQFSQRHWGGALTDKDLWQMATGDAARSLGLEASRAARARYPR